MPTRIQSLEKVLMKLVGARGLARFKTLLQREIRVQQFLESVGFHFSEDHRERQGQKILAMVSEVLADFGGERKPKPQSASDDTRATSIDRLLTFLTQRCNHSRIEEWRQDIENQQAKKENRTPKKIVIKTANRDFGRALKSDRSPHSNSAQQLVRELLKQPDIVAYYKKDEDLPELDVVRENALQVHAAQRHFVAQAKDKRNQAQACKPGQQKILLKQQAACFADLADALVGTAKGMNDANMITQLSENPSLTPKTDAPWVIAYKDYAQFMQKAARLGLGDDPFIRQWHIHQDRQPGSKRILSKPIPVNEQKIYTSIETMRHRGYSWRHSHQVLMKRKLIPQKSWPAFVKWLKRRNMQALYPLLE